MDLQQAPAPMPEHSLDERATLYTFAPDSLTADERAQVLRICLRATRDRDTAEDLAQETLLEAWRNWQKLRDAGDPSARMRWLATIASHVCHRWARRAGRDLRRTVRLDTSLPLALSPDDRSGTHADTLGDILADDTSMDTALEQAELAALVERALDLLPRETRDLLIARYLMDAPSHEMARQLGLREPTLSVRLHRARHALQQVLTTALRDDAVACGLLDSSTEPWQETRIWCPSCGQARLHGQLGGSPVFLRLGCPRCGDSSAHFVEHVSYHRTLDGVKTFKAALNRVMDWADVYYREGASAGKAICVRCGHPAPMARRAHTDLPVDREEAFSVHLECTCDAINRSDLSGMALYTPEGRAFWRAHPRIHRVSPNFVEAGGQDAVIIGYKSHTGSAAFDAVYARDTFELLFTHTTTGT